MRNKNTPLPEIAIWQWPVSAAGAPAPLSRIKHRHRAGCTTRPTPRPLQPQSTQPGAHRDRQRDTCVSCRVRGTAMAARISRLSQRTDEEGRKAGEGQKCPCETEGPDKRSQEPLCHSRIGNSSPFPLCPQGGRQRSREEQQFTTKAGRTRTRAATASRGPTEVEVPIPVKARPPRRQVGTVGCQLRTRQGQLYAGVHSTGGGGSFYKMGALSLSRHQETHQGSNSLESHSSETRAWPTSPRGFILFCCFFFMVSGFTSLLLFHNLFFCFFRQGS